MERLLPPLIPLVPTAVVILMVMRGDLYRRVFFRDSATTFVLSTSVLLLTTTGFLALSISLRSVYLWLAVVFVALIFLATLTCTCSLPQPGSIDTFNCPDTAVPTITGDLTTLPAQFQSTGTRVPFWIAVDPPPSYEVVVCDLPPSYSKATSSMLKLELPGNLVRIGPTTETVSPVV